MTQFTADGFYSEPRLARLESLHDYLIPLTYIIKSRHGRRNSDHELAIPAESQLATRQGVMEYDRYNSSTYFSSRLLFHTPEFASTK